MRQDKLTFFEAFYFTHVFSLWWLRFFLSFLFDASILENLSFLNAFKIFFSESTTSIGNRRKIPTAIKTKLNRTQRENVKISFCSQKLQTDWTQTGHITSLENSYIIHNQMIDVVWIGHRLWAKGSISVFKCIHSYIPTGIKPYLFIYSQYRNLTYSYFV